MGRQAKHTPCWRQARARRAAARRFVPLETAMAVTHWPEPEAGTARRIPDFPGPVEDGTVATVLDIGPNSAEILEVHGWLRSDDRIRQAAVLHGHGGPVTLAARAQRFIRGAGGRGQ